MDKTNKITFSFILLIYLSSCGGLSDAGKVLRNEKIKTSDEFLVKKREPLTLPPEYEKIPVPGSLNKKKEEKNNIEKILNTQNNQTEPQNKTSSVEQSIINQIGK